MRITKQVLHDQAEQAFRVVWWFRTSDFDNPEVKVMVEYVEAMWPGLLAGLDREDTVAMLRWEGRLATLRHLDSGAEDQWNGEGAFDS